MKMARTKTEWVFRLRPPCEEKPRSPKEQVYFAWEIAG
jgi:hypothetical protein